MGENKKAIKFLTKRKNDLMIVDDVRKNEMLARLYAANNQQKKAVETLESLLRLNSSNSEYYHGILRAEGIVLQKGDIVKADQREQFLEIMGKYVQVLPKSSHHTKIIVTHLEAGEDFKQRFYEHVKPQLIKGVPSMINDFRILYKQEGKAKIIGDLLLELCDNMEKEMVLKLDDKEEQDPTV